MNSRGLSGVLMLGAAAGLAWAWLNGHLDSTIAKITNTATGKGVKASASKLGGFGRAGRES